MRTPHDFKTTGYPNNYRAVVVGRGPSATPRNLANMWLHVDTGAIFFVNDAVMMLDGLNIDPAVKVFYAQYDGPTLPRQNFKGAKIDTAALPSRVDYCLVPCREFKTYGPKSKFVFMVWPRPVPTALMSIWAAHIMGYELITLVGMDSYRATPDLGYSPDAYGLMNDLGPAKFAPEPQWNQLDRMPQEALEKCVHFDGERPVWRIPNVSQ